MNQIIAELKGTGRNQMTLIKAFEYHNNKLEELSGIEFAHSTIDKYGYALNSIKKFLRTIYNKTDIRLCDLIQKFIVDYHAFLRISENLMHNSATKYLKNLQRVINISITNKCLPSNLFQGFSCNYVNPSRLHLTEEEIDN